ncbi:MAG: TraB/GumN family protein [Arenimonas sp.]
MKKILAPLLMLFGINAAYAETPTPSAVSPPKPLLWKVSDKDNSLYLLGSFHMLKPSDYPLAKSTDLAFDDAEQLYFELSPEEMNDPALGQKMAQAAMRTDGKTLQQSVSAETWAKFEAYATSAKLPTANFQVFEPWFVTLILSVTEMQKIGLDQKLGLDKHFMDRAAKAGKPAKGLETGESQIAIFDSMSAKLQEQFLLDALDESVDMKKKINELHDTWRQADDKTLFNKMASEMRQKYPELYQSINVERNKAWLPKLEAMLKDNDKDDVMVVVGSLHLVGDDGVIKMLKEHGYQVERMN